ncbi:NAD(P)/FAD-dependent oxidoreductase [soil metagenome]
MLVDGHYMRYPLVGRDLLTQMGLRRGMHGLGNLLWSKARRWMSTVDDSDSFRKWGTHEFGHYWYTMFFDGYIRKTWLTEPDDIASDWANQRIKPIDWRLTRESDSADREVFRYPLYGPGQLWEAAAAKLTGIGVAPALNSQVVKARFDGDRWAVKLNTGAIAVGDALFSSMPLRLLVQTLVPEPPKHIRAAAAALKHRALITVAVALREHYDMPYNWVYTPGKEFQVGRIQNYSRWSSALAPANWSGTYLGLEYFTVPDEHLWIVDNASLGTIVEQDLRALGLHDSTVEHVAIVRSEFAYPMYDPARDACVALIRDYLRETYPTLHPIGRNGMHRYDNQDHAMLSAMQSVDRYFGDDVDPWQVNTDPRYHEHGLLKK